jgi:hypothetical protein
MAVVLKTCLGKRPNFARLGVANRLYIAVIFRRRQPLEIVKIWPELPRLPSFGVQAYNRSLVGPL